MLQPPARASLRPLSHVLFFGWAALVVAVYFRRAWALLLAGPAGWDLRAGLASAAAPLAIAACVVTAAVAVSRHRLDRRTLCAASAAILLAAAVADLLWPHRIERVLAGIVPAVARAGLSAAAAMLILFDGYVVGSLALTRLRETFVGWHEAFVFREAVGLAALSYLLLTLAVAGGYRPAVIAGVLIVLAAAGGAANARVISTGAVRFWRTARLKACPTGGAAAGRGCVLIAALAVAYALVGALAPEIEYDALWYHLWLPRMWLLHGTPADIPAEYVSLYPMTWELLYGAALATAGPVAAKLLHFACLPLVALTVWQFVRRFFPARDAWLAVAMTLACPTVLWEATTAYIDLAVALYVTLGLYALCASFDASGRSTRGWFPLAAICLGIAAAIKHLGLIVLTLAVAGLLIRCVLRHRRRLRPLAQVVAFGAIGLSIPFPWYVRSWLASGNPFFPEMYKVFGGPPMRWDAVSERGLDLFKAHFGLPRTPLNLALLPWNVTIHAALYGGCLGAIFLVALPAVFRWRSPTTAYRWLACVVLGYVVVWASPVSSFQLRFLVPIVPALATLCSVAVADAIERLPGPAGRLAFAMMLALLAVNLPPFIPLHEGDRDGWNRWLTHVVRHVPLGVVIGERSPDDYLREQVATYGAWRYAAGHLRQGDVRVLEFGGGDNFYATADRLSMDAPAARDAWSYNGDNAQELEQALVRLGVTHVLFDRSVMRRMTEQHVDIASPWFRERLPADYEDQRAVLYRATTLRGR